MLTNAWQYPDVTCARITLHSGEVFETENFRETKWVQTSNIKRGDDKTGAIDIFYLVEKPPGDEGPYPEGREKST